MFKKLMYVISIFLMVGLAFANVTPAAVIEVRVAAGEDDAEEKVDTGAIDLTSSDLEITEEGEPALNQLVGMRFANVAIPQGATITSAYVQFQVDETDVPGDNRPGTKFLKGEAVDDAASFTDAPFDISSRPTTTAEASWDWPEWLIEDEEGPDQQTSDISAVIQEIVDRPGWASGNALVLIITGSGENAAESFNGEETAAALLHVEFVGEPTKPGTNGLVAYYALDGDPNDSSGNGLNGTLVGDATFAEGKVGMALSVDGDGDYVDSGSPAELVLTEAISIACWVNPAQLGGEQGFAGMDAGYYFKAHGEGVRFTTPGILDHSSANLILTAGAWQHVAATFQPGQDEGLVFYLNGVETERLTSSAINPASGPFRIGSNQWDEYLTGMIDEVMIYNRILSEAEIRYLAGERPTPVDPGTDALLAFFPLENDVMDASGNGNDGTIVGDPVFVEGAVGMAMEFDGDDYVDTGNVEDLAEWTIGCWAKSPMAPSGGSHSESGPVHREKNYQFNWNHSNEVFRASVAVSAGGWHAASLGTLEADTWYYLAGTYDGETLKSYVDGELITVNEDPSGPPAAESNSLKLARHAAAGPYFTGAVDEAIVYSRVLSIGEIRYLAGFRATVEMDPSLVIYYSFDEVTDIVADQSGKGHDGVVVGDVTAESQGMYGGAASFANSGYLDLDGANFPAEDIPTSAMTLTAWIKCANTGGDHEIFNARASDETWIMHPEPKSSGDIRWLLRSYGGTTIFQIRDGTMTWDEWLHFAGTYDKEAGKAALYINGELIEELDVESPADIAGDWGLGARVGLTIDNARPFTGLMDEFRMYKRALSQDEILEIMQGM